MSVEKQARLLELMGQESSAGLVHYKAFEAEPPAEAERLRRAAHALMAAGTVGDERSARESAAALAKAPESDLENLAETLCRTLDAGASGAFFAWLAESGWLARAEAPTSARRGGPQESAVSRLAARLSAAGNREGLDALADARAISLDEALALSASSKKPSVCLHFSNRMEREGVLPSEATASLVCASLCSMFSRLLANPRAPHPMERHLTAWAGLIDQKARSRAWEAAVAFERPELMATLLRAGLDLEDWRLSHASDSKTGFPTLLERAVELSAHAKAEGGPAAPRALLLIDSVAAGKGSVRPRFFSELGYDTLKALKKLGFNLAAQTPEGDNFLHINLSENRRRPRGAEFKKLGALLGEMWHQKNEAGRSALDCLSPAEQSLALAGVAEFEKKAMKKSAGSAPAAKSSPRSL